MAHMKQHKSMDAEADLVMGRGVAAALRQDAEL